MKNAIFLTLAAAVATIPAILGVTGNTTFSQSIPASIPSGASVVPSVDDHPHATATSTSATPSAESGDDRRGRGSDDGATAAASRSTAIAQTTVDDHGVGTEAGDDSGGHGGRSGNSGQARDD